MGRAVLSTPRAQWEVHVSRPSHHLTAIRIPIDVQAKRGGGGGGGGGGESNS